LLRQSVTAFAFPFGMTARSRTFKIIGICIAIFCLCGPLLSFAHDYREGQIDCEEALAGIPGEQKQHLAQQVVDVAIGHGFWGRFQRKALQARFYQELSEIGYATRGLLYDDVKRRAQLTFDQMPVGPGAPANIRSTIAQGQILERVFVVTHQSVGLQRGTANLLKEPRFAAVPRVMLVNGNFFSARRSYADQASIFLFSDGGEVTVPLVAKTVYLAGGFSSLCLARTIHAVVEQAEAKGMDEMTLHLFPDLTYYTDKNAKLSPQMNVLRASNLMDLAMKTILRNLVGAQPIQSSGFGPKWVGELKLPSGLRVRVELERSHF